MESGQEIDWIYVAQNAYRDLKAIARKLTRKRTLGARAERMRTNAGRALDVSRYVGRLNLCRMFPRLSNQRVKV